MIEGRIDRYLDHVAAGLPGSRRDRSGIIAELRTSLCDAVDANIETGQSSVDACTSAIDEFGPPDQVADAFRAELTVRQARRVAIGLLLGSVAIGALWLHAAQSSDHGVRNASWWNRMTAPPVPLALTGLIVAGTVALIVLTPTGRLSSWLPQRPRLVAITAAWGGLGAAVTDLAVLILLGVQLFLAPHNLAPAPVATAALASSVRIALAKRAARQCLSTTHSGRLFMLHS
jgi:hypothetical protein